MRVERIDRKGTQGAEFYGGTEQGQKLDEDLVHEALRGSDIAFGTLFERYERRMFLIAYRILRNREDAEDAVQQAFKHAFVRLNSFQGDSRFSTWMARITINEALQLLRKRRPGHTSIEGHTGSEGKPGRLEIEDAGATPEEHFNERELCGILKQGDQRVAANFSRRRSTARNWRIDLGGNRAGAASLQGHSKSAYVSRTACAAQKAKPALGIPQVRGWQVPIPALAKSRRR